MSEILSKQGALIAAGKKLQNAQDLGRERSQVMNAPAVLSAMQIGDTMGTGQLVPAGSRLLGAVLSNAAGTASQTVSVGIRDFNTKVVIDAAAIGSAVAISSAQVVTVNNGTKIAAGIDYVTTVDTEIYITNAGAAGPANHVFSLRAVYLGA